MLVIIAITEVPFLQITNPAIGPLAHITFYLSKNVLLSPPGHTVFALSSSAVFALSSSSLLLLKNGFLLLSIP